VATRWESSSARCRSPPARPPRARPLTHSPRRSSARPEMPSSFTYSGTLRRRRGCVMVPRSISTKAARSLPLVFAHSRPSGRRGGQRRRAPVLAGSRPCAPGATRDRHLRGGPRSVRPAGRAPLDLSSARLWACPRTFRRRVGFSTVLQGREKRPVARALQCWRGGLTSEDAEGRFADGLLGYRQVDASDGGVAVTWRPLAEATGARPDAAPPLRQASLETHTLESDLVAYRGHRAFPGVPKTSTGISHTHPLWSQSTREEPNASNHRSACHGCFVGERPWCGGRILAS
jgi:hypothetical protein